MAYQKLGGALEAQKLHPEITATAPSTSRELERLSNSSGSLFLV